MRTENGSATGGKARALVSVLIVVLLAVAGFLGWSFWGRALPFGGPYVDASSGVAGRSPEDRLAMADLGGAKENYARIRDLTGLGGMKILTRAEQEAYLRAGVSRVRVGVTDYDDGSGRGKADAVKATLVLVHAANPGAARTAADELGALQSGFGFHPDDDVRPGVRAGLLRGKPTEDPPVPGGGRAHYAHDDVLVRVEVRGPDDAAARERFQQVLDDQLAVLAADA